MKKNIAEQVYKFKDIGVKTDWIANYLDISEEMVEWVLKQKEREEKK